MITAYTVVDGMGVERSHSTPSYTLVVYTLVLWATHHADVGIVSALRETSVLWAIVIGRKFLGEAFTWRRTVSASVTCCGDYAPGGALTSVVPPRL
jgi:hypothetical protein